MQDDSLDTKAVSSVAGANAVPQQTFAPETLSEATSVIGGDDVLVSNAEEMLKKVEEKYILLEKLLSHISTTISVESSYEKEYLEIAERKLLESSYTAYLKIAEGCDNICAYCVIPSIRGGYRSRKIDDILAEARSLARHRRCHCWRPQLRSVFQPFLSARLWLPAAAPAVVRSLLLAAALRPSLVCWRYRFFVIRPMRTQKTVVCRRVVCFWSRCRCSARLLPSRCPSTSSR